MCRPALFAISLLTAATSFADFSYSDFSDISDFSLNGTAHQVGNIVRMTDDQINDQAGNLLHNAAVCSKRIFDKLVRFP